MIGRGTGPFKPTMIEIKLEMLKEWDRKCYPQEIQ